MLKETDLRQMATDYIWNDYVNAATEHEEVNALMSLLRRVYIYGQENGFPECPTCLLRHDPETPEECEPPIKSDL